MRRSKRPTTFFRGRELPRLMTMLVMLVVLGMMYQRAREESTWYWFTGESGPGDGFTPMSIREQKSFGRDRLLALADSPATPQPTSPQPISPQPATPQPANDAKGAKTAPAEAKPVDSKPAETPPAKSPPAEVVKPDEEKPSDAKPAAANPSQNKPAEGKPTGKSPSPPEPVSPDETESGLDQTPGAAKAQSDKALGLEPPPWDEDPVEIDALREELGTLMDRTVEIKLGDMPAYWRLMTWAKKEPLESLRKRAKRGLVYTDFMQRPKQHRGQLVRLDLNVRRALVFPMKEDNPAEAKQTYEIWGFTEESRGWPYCLVTDELPKGMPQGSEINETVTFYGYFLKLQGYEPAGAKPGDKPLWAPLLIGKVEWRPAPPLKAEDPVWAWWVLGGAAVIIFGTIAGWMVRGGRPAGPTMAIDETRKAGLDEWLARGPVSEGPAEEPTFVEPGRNNRGDNE